MRWVTRIRGGRRRPEVEQEAAIDLRDGQIEGLRDRIAELEREKAAIEFQLMLARLPQWLPMLTHRRAAPNPDKTVVVPGLHAPTEYIPRRAHRG